MPRLISIEPFVPSDDVHIATDNPNTKRRYAVESNIIASLKKFNDKGIKKGAISSEEIGKIKPEFSGELPEYEEKVTIKSVFRKLGTLNGKLSQDKKLKKFVVSPNELNQALENLEKQAYEMEDLLKKDYEIINEKNNKIQELEKEIENLNRENQELKTVNEILINGNNQVEDNMELEKVR
jgi:chromosome segregation ATPase